MVEKSYFRITMKGAELYKRNLKIPCNQPEHVHFCVFIITHKKTKIVFALTSRTVFLYILLDETYLYCVFQNISVTFWPTSERLMESVGKVHFGLTYVVCNVHIYHVMLPVK